MKITIIGAGYSGLATATFLHHLGVERDDITLLEGGPHIGGLINTLSEEGYVVETGPEGIRGNSEMANQLIDITRARDLCVPSSNISADRYLVHKGRLVKMPHGPLGAITTPLLSIRSKLRLLVEPLVKSSEIPVESSLSELLNRRFGSGIDHVLDAFVSGVYAGDHRRLSASFVFPKLAEFERTSGSIIRGGIQYLKERKKLKKQNGEDRTKAKKPPFLINFEGGMLSLVERMAEGFNVHTNTPVHSIKQVNGGYLVQTGDGSFSSDVVVVATSPNNTPRFLVDDLPPLPKMPTAPVAVVALGFDGDSIPHKPRGYGYLAPSGEGRFALGTLFTSDVFPHHAPEGKVLLRVIIGGRRHPEYLTLDDETILERVMEDISPLLKLDGASPEFFRVIRQRTGIPQLELGHGLIDEFRTHVEGHLPGVYFNAIGWTGISTAHLAEEAHRIARGIVGPR